MLVLTTKKNDTANYQGRLGLFLNRGSDLLYADDTTIFASDKNLLAVQDKLNADLANVHSWCVKNKLSINPSKTTLMVFHSSRTYHIDSIVVSLNNNVLRRSASTKFLGVVLDENLKFQCHIQSLIQKISFGIHIIIKTRSSFQQTILMSLYYAYIHSHLSYCLSSWGNTYAIHLHQLEVLQKQALRLIAFQSHTSPSAPIFRSLNVLPLRMLFNHKLSLLMFRLINTELNIPGFTRSSLINYNNTRYSAQLNLLLPKARTNYGKFTVAFLGISVWNSIPSDMKSSTLLSFKRRTKEHFMNTLSDT